MVIEEDWLIRIFEPENLKDIYITVLQREETCFRLMYANATGKEEDGTEKTFHCFLKYHMSVIDFVVEDPRPKEYFASERYWYDVIYPTFVEFQRAKGVDTPFDNVPKCYGTLQDEISQVLIQRVIVLENLKIGGHVVWPNRQTLSRRHLETVLEAYAKLHATAAAMQKHEPQRFDDIIDKVRQLEHRRKTALGDEEKYAQYEPGLVRLFQFLELNRGVQLPEKKTQEKNDEFLDQGAALWTAKSTAPCMRVIIHGDCWTSNFLSKFEDPETKTVAKDLMIVDWQMIKFGSLVFDLSSFLFSFISEEDIQHLDALLHFYYGNFCTHLRKLGIPDTNAYYPYEQFKDEWKQFCRYGFIATFHALVAGNEGGGAATNDVFLDVAILTQKMKHVVEYLKQHDLMQM